MATTPKGSNPRTSLTRSAGYLAATFWAAIAAMHVYWALGDVWGARAVLGEGNPVPPPLVLWLAVVVPLAFALIVLGRMGVWGRHLPGWIFGWGMWAMSSILVLVSALNLTGGNSWEALFGALALFLALVCAIVAVSKPASARLDGIVGNDPAEREE
jgi:hypothetical protein